MDEIDIYNFQTGIPSLDMLLMGVKPGDNIVWQVDFIEDYIPFVLAFCRKANSDKKPLIYFRFATHKFLISDDIEAKIYELDPNEGFENFLSKIFKIIEEFGLGACYVFDCLSDLAVDWYSDVMLANFFMLTCPYLYQLNTATYFALIRNHNAIHAIKDIHNTAQVVLDLYRYDDDIYMHPLKVEKRHSTTMYMLHKWRCKNKLEHNSCLKSIFTSVTDSITTSKILTRIEQPWLDFSVKRQDVWSISFRNAQEILEKGIRDKKYKKKMEEAREKLIRMSVARKNDARFQLAHKFFSLQNLLEIGKRMVGTGLIGGKSVGMLLARAIIEVKKSEIINYLEPHDSFFVGSDVFYTYLVKNNIWWDRRKISDPDTFLDGLEKCQHKIHKGKFTSFISQQFKDILNYYGQSPIIVRSSSIQEDAFGNAFSGKYESVFLANQGTPEDRYIEFCKAVKTVYGSAISKEALIYRKSRGLLNNDEQMALLIQRVSGSIYSPYYFPLVAGVAFSYNPFVWDPSIDPHAGFLRVVAGLGTRAVDRTSDDYTRLIALNKPHLRPESTKESIHKYSQNKLDLIDLEKNKNTTYRFKKIALEAMDYPIDKISSEDYELKTEFEQRGRGNLFTRYMDFDYIINKTDALKKFQEILKTVAEAYNSPVDIEFTLNFIKDDYQINLLQCRTFQVRTTNNNIEDIDDVKEENILFKTHGPIIGNSIATKIDRLIYVVPKTYGKLPIRDRYSIARLIGEIAKLPFKKKEGDEDRKILLMGPGRWGTSSPSLGIPVSFSEIKNVSMIGEIAEMHEGLIPDLSLGSHFFNDLVELDMLYFAIHPNRDETIFNREILEKNMINSLVKIYPKGIKWEKVVQVIDVEDKEQQVSIFANMNSLKQKATLYFIKK